jgi:hypothetical protein
VGTTLDTRRRLPNNRRVTDAQQRIVAHLVLGGIISIGLAWLEWELQPPSRAYAPPMLRTGENRGPPPNAVDDPHFFSPPWEPYR